MKTSDFNFDLPENLIAQFPTGERGSSRLMVLDRKSRNLEHSMVSQLPRYLEKGTLLVFNNSRVRKARLFGIAESTGAKAEFLLLKKIDDNSWQVLAKRSKRRKPGSSFIFNDVTAVVESPSNNVPEGEGIMVLSFDPPIDDTWLDRNGHIPLPPYIRRTDMASDTERYQTIYASQIGSSAAPTAGLHFTEQTLKELQNAGMETVYLTLHVGLGTFLPVRTKNIEDHIMHEEAFCIGEEEAQIIEKAKREKRKILAVGTTVMRTLESAWVEDTSLNGSGRLARGEGLTSIFMYPGYRFRVADMLFTNFHTPMSTLLMLISAFAGKDFILDSYKEAVKKGYRFFSYGDACLIK